MKRLLLLDFPHWTDITRRAWGLLSMARATHSLYLLLMRLTGPFLVERTIFLVSSSGKPCVIEDQRSCLECAAGDCDTPIKACKIIESSVCGGMCLNIHYIHA